MHSYLSFSLVAALAGPCFPGAGEPVAVVVAAALFFALRASFLISELVGVLEKVPGRAPARAAAVTRRTR